MKSRLNTGDILLFSGKGIGSTIIKIATTSKYSHIGMVLNIEDVPYCYHSTTIMKPKGTKIQRLDDVIQKYNGKIYTRALRPPLTDPEKLEKLFRHCTQQEGVGYESSLWELALSALGRKFNINLIEESKDQYCSELVRNAFNEIGILKTKKMLTPADFSPDGDWYLGQCYKIFGSLKQIISLENSSPVFCYK